MRADRGPFLMRKTRSSGRKILGHIKYFRNLDMTPGNRHFLTANFSWRFTEKEKGEIIFFFLMKVIESAGGGKNEERGRT